MENAFRSEKSWKFKLKVPKILEFAEMQWWRHGRENIHVRTPLVFVIRSHNEKTFFFTTCDSDEHCSMDATVMLLYVE